VGVSEAPHIFAASSQDWLTSNLSPGSGIACVLEFSVAVAGAGVVAGRRLIVSESRLDVASGLGCFDGNFSIMPTVQTTVENIAATLDVSGFMPGEAPGLLVPAPLAHDRSGHAEFKALLEVLGAVTALGVDMHPNESRSHVVGTVHLYVDHHPCLSCVGAICQFRTVLPNVTTRVAYDWSPETVRGRNSV